MHTLKFLAEVSANGVVERDFIVDGVPGVIWSPTSGAERAAVVLLGHGGGYTIRQRYGGGDTHSLQGPKNPAQWQPF